MCYIEYIVYTYYPRDIIQVGLYCTLLYAVFDVNYVLLRCMKECMCLGRSRPRSGVHVDTFSWPLEELSFWPTKNLSNFRCFV